MARFTISGHVFELEHEGVEEAVTRVLPDPVREHYVVVRGRRYPPKQILACVTGLDRADFTTHQARRILKRLGFVAARRAPADEEAIAEEGHEGPYGGRQAAALEPYMGKWVAMAGPLEVLVAADTPQEILAWLAKHGRRAEYGMFRVPRPDEDVVGAAPL
jgi:hypothetical protein